MQETGDFLTADYERKYFKKEATFPGLFPKVYTKGADRKSSQWPIQEQFENKNI